jgi:hypothetical protein
LPNDSKKKILRKHQALLEKHNFSKKTQRFENFDHKKSSFPRIHQTSEPTESFISDFESKLAQKTQQNEASYRKMEKLRKMNTNLSIDTKFDVKNYFEENLLTASSRELLANQNMEP